MTESSALAIKPGQEFWDERQLAALRQLGVEEAPQGDLAVFLHYAQRTGLDPFSRQIYMIGRYDRRTGGKRWSIQTGIDALRIVAQRSGEYAGQVGPEWCGEDGVWRDVWLADEHPSAARVGVMRRGFVHPLYRVAHWDEYAVTDSRGALTGLWPSKGRIMIAKCAEALALRSAFPHDLSGLYVAEEMGQADQAGLSPMDKIRAEVAANAAEAAAVDPALLAGLRRGVLDATTLDNTDDLLTAIWHDAKAAGALNAKVLVPEGWRSAAGAEEVALSALIVGAREAKANGLDHGEPAEAPDGDQVEAMCDAVRRKDGAHCGYLLGHPGRHDYVEPEPPTGRPEQEPRTTDEIVVEQCDGTVSGWPCILPAGHDGEHSL